MKQRPQSFLFLLSHFSTLFTFYSIYSFASTLLLTVTCPCCPFPVPWLYAAQRHHWAHQQCKTICYHHCKLCWGPMGQQRGIWPRGLQLDLFLSMVKLHLFNMHKEPPEEKVTKEKKEIEKIKLWVAGLFLQLLVAWNAAVTNSNNKVRWMGYYT